MKYDVLAQAFDRNTGVPNGPARIEQVDTSTNRVFQGCNTVQQVEQAYESFWNDLNPNSTEIVFVSQVTPRIKSLPPPPEKRRPQ